MLSIGKLAAGPTAGRYYEDAVAGGREDYYAGEGEAPGRWHGSGASRLRLSGQVSEGEVGRLLAAEHPASGELLGAAMGDGSVAGFDLTFNTPKSVSVAFGIGDPWTARVLRECHDRAVTDALAFLEREACRARRGAGGLQVVKGEGFAAAAFEHRTSRAGDPQLHTHVVVSNRTLGPDGRWTALDARPLYRQAKTAGFLYQARLRYEVTERLGARWGPVHKGAADLVGVPRDVIDHFSQRRAEVLAEMELHGSHSLAAGNAAALATRKGKDHGVPMERLREQWRARAGEHGLTRERVEELLTPRWREQRPPGVADVEDLTASAATFTRRDVLQAVCEAHRDGAATITELEAKADTLLNDIEVVAISDPAETRYTTRRQVDMERNLLQAAEDSRGKDRALADPDRTNAAIDGRGLSDEQEQAVRALTSSGHALEVFRAPAGAGKTFALDAAREAWQSSAHEVIGCALSAQAARELREQAGIETQTIAQLKHALDRGYRPPTDGVLVVDEAGMVGTKDLAKLEAYCSQFETKLLLVGDDRQLPEIEAGGAFRAIAERVGAVELTEIRRQDQQWDRQALTALREGRPAEWAKAYIEHARVTTAESAPALREQLVDDWWTAKQTGCDARMIALRRSDVSDLNQRARERMHEDGRLGPDIDINGKPFAAGDEVVVTHNDRKLGVLNGDRGTIRQAAQTHVDVDLDKAQSVRVPRSFIDDGRLDHGYATTAHKAQGATVDRSFVLGSQEAYREWGYAALSRHRDEARYYVTEPKPFLNQDPVSFDREQLELFLADKLDDSRRHELAIEALERHPPRDTGRSRLLDGDPFDFTPRPAAPDHDLGMDFGP